MNQIDEYLRKQVETMLQTTEFADAVALAMQKRFQTNNVSDEWARSVLPLLKEYTMKLENIELPDDQQYFITLQPSVRSLAQFVSQRLSNTRDDVLRLELQLRLAEFESALKGAGRRRKVIIAR